MILLLGSDIRAIADALSVTEREARATYCEVNAQLSDAAGTQVMQLQANAGRCVFLTASNLCGIHDRKPFQCRHGPERMLHKAMSDDYECMRDVDVDERADVTEYFFVTLLSGDRYAE
jgi:Fe-S-cluster containining protein